MLSLLSVFSETPQDIRSSASRISDGAAVAEARKSDAADGRIVKEVRLKIIRSAHW